MTSETPATQARDMPVALAQIQCCPELEECSRCESLDVRYRLPFRPQVGDGRQVVPVEVTLLFRLTRCSRHLSMGDLIYTTTLLPGEKVRIFTSDRHSRFTYDSESGLSYRHETTSEESYFAAGMATAMSDLDIVESSRSSSSFHESSVSGGGGLGVDLGIIEIGGSASGSSYNADSTSEFARSVSQHAESSSRHMEVATRAQSSTSVGEVQTRSHREGESEDHFESNSRVFSNPNTCRAITYLFHKIDKCQELTFELVAIERVAQDPIAPTTVKPRPFVPTSTVAVLPRPVLASASERLRIEQADRESLQARLGAKAAVGLPPAAFARMPAPQFALTEQLKRAAIRQVDEELVEAGLLDKETGEPTKEARRRFEWEREIKLPTPGVLVRGCLDECDICEPELHRRIELELERKALENRLLERRIELLEKEQEYRCCPDHEDANENDD